MSSNLVERIYSSTGVINSPEYQFLISKAMLSNINFLVISNEPLQLLLYKLIFVIEIYLPIKLLFNSYIQSPSDQLFCFGESAF